MRGFQMYSALGTYTNGDHMVFEWGTGSSSTSITINFGVSINGGPITQAASDTMGSSNSERVLTASYTPQVSGTYAVYSAGDSSTGWNYGGTFTWTAINAPTNVNCPSSAMKGSSVQVNWNSSGSGLSYNVEFYNGTSWVSVGNTTNCYISYPIYSSGYFRVNATNGSFTTDWTQSGYLYMDTNTPPNAPTSITVPTSAAAKSTVNIFWDSPNQSIYAKYDTTIDTVDLNPGTAVTIQFSGVSSGSRWITLDTGYTVNNHKASSTGTKSGIDAIGSAGGYYMVSESQVIKIGSYLGYAMEDPAHNLMNPDVVNYSATIVFSTTTKTVKNNYIGDVTAPYKTYPNDGISGAYWYTYKGVSPSVDADGDTISYKLEFYNGTTWATCGTTNATNMNYTLPDIETKTAKFRVTAIDSRGGTSGTITSTDFSIFRLQMYVSVSGASKRVLGAYARVDGALKQVSAIYTRIDGVIKR
jgi:hypothetical protein